MSMGCKQKTTAECRFELMAKEKKKKLFDYEGNVPNFFRIHEENRQKNTKIMN